MLHIGVDIEEHDDSNSQELESSPELFLDNEAVLGLNSPNCSQSKSQPDTIKQPQLIHQPELNDLIRELSLPKNKSEYLASWLQERNLLMPSTKVTVYRKRNAELTKFFQFNNSKTLCYCSDINGLMLELGIKHRPEEWRLFIDSAKASLKAVLLHNGNEKPSVPVAHSTTLKETYESMNMILNELQYERFEWELCGDLKVIALILGLQGGFTKFMCPLCLWDSRATNFHYIRKDWPQRPWQVGAHNVKQTPLIDPSKIILPPLHIKLGLIKNFVKALDKNGDAFMYLKEKFSRLSEAKLKEGVFDGPQIRQLLKDANFRKKLKTKELAAWSAFECVVYQFLGNYRDPNFKILVTNLLQAYRDMGVRMSLKIHFLHSHLGFFPENLGHKSDEQGKRNRKRLFPHSFSQCIKTLAHKTNSKTLEFSKS